MKQHAAASSGTYIPAIGVERERTGLITTKIFGESCRYSIGLRDSDTVENILTI